MHEYLKREEGGRLWVRVCRAAEVGERNGFHVEVDIEIDLALFRVNGELFAINNVCPHKREAFIFDGVVENGTVTCPVHHWKFDIRTGSNVNQGGGLSCYAVKEIDSYVWVDVGPTE